VAINGPMTETKPSLVESSPSFPSQLDQMKKSAKSRHFRILAALYGLAKRKRSDLSDPTVGPIYHKIGNFQ
jgi:hypothetical protein